MDTLNLNDPQQRTDYLYQAVLTNVTYWQEWLRVHQTDLVSLDRERQLLLRAMGFAIEAGQPAWPGAYDLLLNLTGYMERRGHWDAWREALTRALTLSGLLHDQAAVVNLTALLARLSFQQSQFAESVRLYRRAIRLARPLGDRFNEARACTNMGYYYVEHGEWWRAEVLCRTALHIFEEIDSHHGRAHAHNHLGTLYLQQGRWPEAQQHLEQACALWQAMGDDHGVMRGLINLSTLYLRMEQPAAALNYINQALEQARLVGEEALIGTIYMNRGHAHILAGQLMQAEIEVRRAETIYRRFANSSELARVWGYLGVICCRRGQWPEAAAYLENALATWRSLGRKLDEIYTLLDMVDYELAQDHHRQARLRLQEAEQLIGLDTQGWYRHLQTRLANYQVELNKRQ